MTFVKKSWAKLVLALIVYFALSVNVGRARATWNVPAPQASGHPEFDKRYRVQMNTLEQLALSPQCGFSSTVHGNNIAMEVQRNKLRLVIETAQEVWGNH